MLILSIVGSLLPSNICVATDILLDTINDPLDNNDWDEKTVQSDFVNNFPAYEKLNSTTDFAKDRMLLVNLKFEDDRKHDVYIDNFIKLVADIKKSVNNNFGTMYGDPHNVPFNERQHIN